MEAGTHIIAIDLGFAGEPTALAVLTPSTKYFWKDPRETELDWETSFEVPHLERFPAGNSYLKVAKQTKELQSDRKRLPRSVVVINTSSSGTEPLKLFRAENIHYRAFTITNGEVGSLQNQTQGVSKRNVVNATVVLLQDGRLKLAKGLDLAESLVTELVNFKMRPKSSTDPIEAMREGKDADLVFAVSLGCWWGDQFTWDDRAAERMLAGGDDFEPAWEFGRDNYTGY